MSFVKAVRVQSLQRSQQSLTQSHALIRDGSDYADLFTLGANHCATLPELAAHQTQTQTQTQTQPEITL